MNLTSIERKHIQKLSNISKQNNANKYNINNDIIKNMNIRKIDPKKFGMKSIIGGPLNNLRGDVSDTISLSHVSEKLRECAYPILELNNIFAWVEKAIVNLYLLFFLHKVNKFF